MTPMKTLHERENELRSLLATPAGREELRELASRYYAASGAVARAAPVKKRALNEIGRAGGDCCYGAPSGRGYPPQAGTTSTCGGESYSASGVFSAAGLSQSACPCGSGNYSVE